MMTTLALTAMLNDPGGDADYGDDTMMMVVLMVIVSVVILILLMMLMVKLVR